MADIFDRAEEIVREGGPDAEAKLMELAEEAEPEERPLILQYVEALIAEEPYG